MLESMTTQLAVFALATGVLTGGLFRMLSIPIPAPPELPGLLGIVGIFLGYKLVEALGIGIDLAEALGF